VSLADILTPELKAALTEEAPQGAQGTPPISQRPAGFIQGNRFVNSDDAPLGPLGPQESRGMPEGWEPPAGSQVSLADLLEGKTKSSANAPPSATVTPFGRKPQGGVATPNSTVSQVTMGTPAYETLRDLAAGSYWRRLNPDVHPGDVPFREITDDMTREFGSPEGAITFLKQNGVKNAEGALKTGPTVTNSTLTQMERNANANSRRSQMKLADAVDPNNNG